MKKLGSVVESQQFDSETLEAVFQITDEMREKIDPQALCGKIIVTDFYEASTRTRFSFEIATLRLGGQYIGTDNARSFSSAAKGESLEDSIRVISSYPVDAIVLRYDKKGGAERAHKFSRVPIINAGDGNGQHPTQALTDLYTIRGKYGSIKGLRIAMMGDLENGRTVRSLSYFLAKHFSDNEIIFISPEKVKMHQDIKDYLDRYNVKWHEFFQLTPELIKSVDVFYQTRVQKERFENNSRLLEEITAAREKFIIDEDFLEQMDENGIIMHPLPRVDEIKYEVDADPRAYYFTQAEYGVYVRMALLKMMLCGY